MKGLKLFEEVFSEQIEKYGEFHLYEIQEEDEVTCYREINTDIDDWYHYTTYQFRFKGLEYSFEMRDHVSDNVCDTTYFMETFKEVEPKNDALHKAIDKMIQCIEDENYGTWEEVVQDLTNLKKFEAK